MKIRVKVELYVDVTLDTDDREAAEAMAQDIAATSATVGFDDVEHWAEEAEEPITYLDLVETVTWIM